MSKEISKDTVKILQGPFYTWEETLEITGLKISELRYYVEESIITPLVYTGQRDFLIFDSNGHNDWTGIAKCGYRGHMTLHISLILDLLDGHSITLGTGWGKLQEPQKVSFTSFKNPFKYPLPMTPISNWESKGKLHTDKLLQFAATPFPRESETVSKLIRGFVEAFSDPSAPKEKGSIAHALDQHSKSPPENYTLNFKHNSIFEPNSLRFAASELAKTKNYNSSAEKSSTLEIAPRNSHKKRKNLFHELIKRIIHENPGINATGVWEILRYECDSDNAIYDIDSILVSIDARSAEWETLHGEPKSISRKTVKNLVSTLASS
ncbi:hypothetical protein [Pseudoteredinibacter isoporae]|uniref:hypothetical protein n=1 Tax=Pseudoteredinibacter isoporae TaxID=570281 RepID=UPI00310C0B6F